MNKKYLIRHHLDSYSEMEFSNSLNKKNFQPFFPFKDEGIDIVAFESNNFKKPFFYQLKARNITIKNNCYSFRLSKAKIEEADKISNFYWVLCALKPSGKFDFFVFPQKIIKKWMDVLNKKLNEIGSEFGEKRFFKIKSEEDSYSIAPRYIKIDPNKYLWKN